MTHQTKRNWGNAVSALLLAAFLMSAFAGTATARDDRNWGGDDHEWRRHEYRARRWHTVHAVPVPGYVYAPPPVVYAPPPVSPGLNLIIPLHFN